MLKQETKEIKIIRNPAIANDLLKMGFRIVQLKQHKGNRHSTVFVFKWSADLQEAVDTMMTTTK